MVSALPHAGAVALSAAALAVWPEWLLELAWPLPQLPLALLLIPAQPATSVNCKCQKLLLAEQQRSVNTILS